MDGGADLTRVSLLRTGGFTGMRLTVSVDTDQLTEKLPAVKISEALRALEHLPSTRREQRSASAGEPRYLLTVQQEAGERTVELTESQIPAQLRPLIQELMHRARLGDGPQLGSNSG